MCVCVWAGNSESRCNWIHHRLVEGLIKAGFVRGGEFSISCGSWNLMDRLGGVGGGGGGGRAAGGGEHSMHVWKYHAAVLCAGHES